MGAVAATAIPVLEKIIQQLATAGLFTELTTKVAELRI